MKALSLTQPMAWAIFHGKDVENRTWKTNFRGRIYIHASKKFDKEHWHWLVRNTGLVSSVGCSGEINYIPYPKEFIHGVIIGEVDITGCRYRHGDMNANLFSPWAIIGQYGFALANPVEYAEPIPCKGKLGFFKVDVAERAERLYDWSSGWEAYQYVPFDGAPQIVREQYLRSAAKVTA